MYIKGSPGMKICFKKMTKVPFLAQISQVHKTEMEMDHAHLTYWCQTTNFHICLHIFKGNSIFMTLFGMDFEFQPPKEGIWPKPKYSERSVMDFYINLIFSDNKYPLFTRFGGEGGAKGDNVTFFTIFYSRASVSPSLTKNAPLE